MNKILLVNRPASADIRFLTILDRRLLTATFEDCWSWFPPLVRFLCPPPLLRTEGGVMDLRTTPRGREEDGETPLDTMAWVWRRPNDDATVEVKLQKSQTLMWYQNFVTGGYPLLFLAYWRSRVLTVGIVVGKFVCLVEPSNKDREARSSLLCSVPLGLQSCSVPLGLQSWAVPYRGGIFPRETIAP